jgi:hypothetical protein
MREIKFRAWDNRNKMFHYWGFNVDNNGAYFTSPPNLLGRGNHKDLEHEQFTGLHDKSGNEIYEGDIDKRKRIVKFIPKRAQYMMWMRVSEDTQFIHPINELVEITGNIHENPELLED